MKNIAFLTLAVFFFNTFETADARWMKKEEASFKVKAHTQVFVKKDLTQKVNYNLTYFVSTERAKELLSIYTIAFVPDRQKFKLDKAIIVHKNGKSVEVNRDKIEYKDLSSAARGFSSRKEVRIPLKQIQVGSRFHIEYSIEDYELQIDNAYSFKYRFLGNGFHYLSEKLTFKSEAPLYFSKRNPNQWIRVKKLGKHHWQLELKRDRALYLIDEFDVFNTVKHYPTFVFSNFPNWKEFKANYLRQVEHRMTEGFPRSLDSIRKKIKSISSTDKKIVEVLKYVVANYTYLGDWRPVKGGHIPRSLAEIEETKYGDCKDFSLLSTRLLRDAGVDASLSLIARGSKPPLLYSEDKLPSIGAFNHMVFSVKSKKGVRYYDPTNLTVIVESTPIDIADRYVLNLDFFTPGIVFTPKVKPEENVLDLKISVEKMNPKSQLLNAQLDYHIYGPEAHYLLYRLLNSPIPVAQLNLRDQVFRGDRVKSHKVLNFPKKQRTLPEGGLKAKYKVVYTGPIIETTQGRGIVDIRSIGFARLPSPEDIKKDRVNDLWLGVPDRSLRKVSFPVNEVSGQLPSPCVVENDFFKRARIFKKENGLISREDELMIKKSVVPHKILMKRKFLDHLVDAKNCSEPFVIVTKGL